MKIKVIIARRVAIIVSFMCTINWFGTVMALQNFSFFVNITSIILTICQLFLSLIDLLYNKLYSIFYYCGNVNHYIAMYFVNHVINIH